MSERAVGAGPKWRHSPSLSSKDFAMEMLGDLVPRAVIDAAARRGDSLEERFIAIACDEDRWMLDSFDSRS